MCASRQPSAGARDGRAQREVAIRLAIGASRRRIVQQLLIESVLLALIGGAAFFLFAAGVHDCLAFRGRESDLTVSTSPDGRVLAFTLVVLRRHGRVSGLAPAWQSAAPRISRTLQSEAPSVGGGRSRLRRALVVSQVAVSLVLLIGAGLFVRTLCQPGPALMLVSIRRTSCHSNCRPKRERILMRDPAPSSS